MHFVVPTSLFALMMVSTAPMAQQQESAGSIQGTVVRADNGDPIAGAQVTLTGVRAIPDGASAMVVGGGFFGAGGTVVTGNPSPVAAQRPGTFPPVVTGSDGRFSFADLPVGNYRVVVIANGYVRQEYGQRVLNSPGRPISLSAGQNFDNVGIALVATGTVSGRMSDESGQPATGIPVQLVRLVFNVQGRNLQVAAAGNADDRGQYRLYGVPPGRYYLFAGNAPGPAGLRGLPAGSSRYSTAFYPGVSEIEQATPVEVRAGSETPMDMIVKRELQTYRVRGRVVDGETGRPPQAVNIMLGYRTLNGPGSFSSGRNYDAATGAFELLNVSPGDYTLQANIQVPVTFAGAADPAALATRQTQQAARPSASLPIRVADADVDGLTVVLSRGVTVSGRVVVEGQPISSVPNIERMRVNFSLTSPVGGTPSPVAMPLNPDGTFEVHGLREGEYRVMVPTPGPGYYLKSFRFGGEEFLNKPFQYSGRGSGAFEIVLSPGAASLGGVVTDSRLQPVAGVQVVLIPAVRRPTEPYRVAMSDPSGHFSMAGIAPGEYRIYSWEAAEMNAFYDPDFLQQYEQQGAVVHITEASSSNVDVKLIPAP